MQRRELPADLPATFTTREAYAAGVRRSRLRAADLVRPFAGVYTRTDAVGSGATRDPVRLAQQYAAGMPSDEFFSHATAAVIWGLPLPRSVAMHEAVRMRDAVVHVSVLRPRNAPRGRGVHGHQVDARLVSVVEHESGLRVTSPASTWAQLGAVLGLADLVAVGDALVRPARRPDDRPQLATPAQLEAAVDAGRRPGVRLLRAALPLVRPRVDSRTETLLRLAIGDAGLPEPVTGFAVAVGTTIVAQVDLAYPRERVAIEYEGEHHLTDPDQWARDIRRYERLADAGWRVIRVTKDDLFRHRPTLIRRIRAALT